MATEILAVPEEELRYVIGVIRAGLTAVRIPNSVARNLKNWCDEEEAYLDENL